MLRAPGYRRFTPSSFPFDSRKSARLFAFRIRRALNPGANLSGLDSCSVRGFEVGVGDVRVRSDILFVLFVGVVGRRGCRGRGDVQNRVGCGAGVVGAEKPTKR